MAVMLRDRPDAQELLSLLGFEPADWRQHYQDLWARYPTLAEDWIHLGFVNLPKTGALDRWELDQRERWRREAAERDHRNLLTLAEVRAKATALLGLRGAARAKKQKALDRRLAELGLRPTFPGGARIPKQERPRLRLRYKELRALVDEIRGADTSGDGNDPQYQLALFIRFPLLTEDDMRIVFSERNPRRGATATAALAILAKRFGTPPATLERYMFTR